MLRIAVVVNEIELLKNRYSDIIPNLKQIMELSESSKSSRGWNKYEFTKFSRTNIRKLFIPGYDDYLLNFDALFIATNALSDEEVYKIFTENKNNRLAIDKFTRTLNRGVFISSQKMVSRTDNKITEIDILPIKYKYNLKNRPIKEADSNEGYISIENDDYLLRKIASLDNIADKEEVINGRCESNPFKPHRYRSIILPLNQDIYKPILIDRKYSNGNHSNVRNLLMRAKNRKIVISTIVLDWSRHNAILENIIRYISEGIPEIAFIGDSSLDLNYKYLLDKATVAKKAFKIFNNINDVKNDMDQYYSTYILSNIQFKKSEKEIKSFWDIIRKKDKFIKFFVIESLETDESILKEFSNYSSIDLVIEEVRCWLAQEYELIYNAESTNPVEGRWGKDLFITYEVMSFFSKLDRYSFRYENKFNYFIDPIFICALGRNFDNKKIDSQNYDDSIGHTSVLLELLCQYNDYIEHGDISGKYNMLGISNWIEQAITFEDNNTTYDNETLALSALQGILTAFRILVNKDNIYTYYSEDFIERLESIILHSRRIEIYLMSMRITSMNDIDLINILEFKMYICKELVSDTQRDKGILEMIKHLVQLQDSSGKWVSIIRTANVLHFLIDFRDGLEECLNKYDRIDYMNIIQNSIDKGINFLICEYQNDGSWGNDVLATVKAASAIELYSRKEKFNTKDFYESIERISIKMREIKRLDKFYDALSASRLEATKQYNKFTTEKLNKNHLMKKYVSMKKQNIITDSVIYALLVLSLTLLLTKFVPQINLTTIASVIIPVICGGAVGIIKYIIMRTEVKKMAQDDNNNLT